MAGAATPVVAQEPEATTREAAIEQAQAEKVKTLHPYVPGGLEGLLNRAEDILVNGVPRWHPFFESAYYGGGFTLGAGYAHHVSPHNLLANRRTGATHVSSLITNSDGVYTTSFTCFTDCSRPGVMPAFTGPARRSGREPSWRCCSEPFERKGGRFGFPDVARSLSGEPRSLGESLRATG